MSACINAPGMSAVATSRFSTIASTMTHDTRTDSSMATVVGELASSFGVYALCWLPFKKMKYPIFSLWMEPPHEKEERTTYRTYCAKFHVENDYSIY
jgi:hypothetical protein